MARLKIEQTAAPDFSAAGQILNNAGKAFDRGLDSAQGVLGSYQDGQAAKADAAIFKDIAKLSNEEELNAFLLKGDFDSSRLSSGVRDRIFGLRSDVLNYGKSRADIAGTNARTNQTIGATSNAASASRRADALANRQATASDRLIAAQDERFGLTKASVAANAEARAAGTDPDAPTAARDAFRQLVSDSLYLESGDAENLFASVYGQSNTGQTLNDKYEAAADAENTALFVEGIAAQEDILTGGDAARQAALTTTADTAVKRAAQVEATAARLGGDSAASNILGGPGNGLSPEITSYVNTATANIDAQLDRNPVVAALRGAQKYQAGDVAEAFVADLERMGVTGQVPAKVRGGISDFARKMKISEAEAAYALRLAAEDDQNFFVGADGILTLFANGLSEGKASTLAEQLFTGDNARATRARLKQAELYKTQIVDLEAKATRAANILAKAIERLGPNETPRPSLVQNAEEAKKALVAAVNKAGQ